MIATDWWKSESVPYGRAAALVRRVTEVCPLRASTQRVLEVTAREDVDLREVARVVEGDPALALRVLRLANSSTYASRASVTDLRIAVVTVGVRELRTLAAAMALFAAFRSAAEDQLDLQEIATVASNLAGSLAARLAPRLETTAFSGGLLCEVGALATLTVDAPEYVQIWKTAYDGRPRWSDEATEIRAKLETERYGATTAELGAMLLARNSLPTQLVRAVGVPTPIDVGAPVLYRIVGFAREAAASLRGVKSKEGIAESLAAIARRSPLHEIAIDEVQDLCADAIQRPAK